MALWGWGSNEEEGVEVGLECSRRYTRNKGRAKRENECPERGREMGRKENEVGRGCRTSLRISKKVV